MPQRGNALALADPALPDASPDDDRAATLLPAQVAYLNAVAGGARTQAEAVAIAGRDPGQVIRWRVNASFRLAERRAWMNALVAKVPKAMQTVDRLLVADVTHESRGLTVAAQTAKWVLEGAGIGPTHPSARPSPAVVVSFTAGDLRGMQGAVLEVPGNAGNPGESLLVSETQPRRSRASSRRESARTRGE